jgi:hypothetical protein
MGFDFLGGSQPGAAQQDTGSVRPVKRVSVEAGIGLKDEYPSHGHFGRSAFR